MKNCLTVLLLLASAVVVNCTKEKSCKQCISDANKPPVADAGANQIIRLPLDSILLDGSLSKDPDNNITGYLWTKIAGPPSVIIANTGAVKTQATKLEEGIYWFELKVTDAAGLSDRDTIEIEVLQLIQPQPQPPPQHYGNIIFYCPDPTGSLKNTWQTWDNGDPINGLYDLVTIKINNLSGILAGVWCKNGCSPRCPVETDYSMDLGNYADFDLPPGTYNWTAENTITDFRGWPGVTPEFIRFFGSIHKAQGIITVSVGDNCIIQPIIFK